jgi:hypothetical protein
MPNYTQKEIFDAFDELVQADFWTTESTEIRRLVEQKGQLYLSEQFISLFKEHNRPPFSPEEINGFRVKLKFLENARSRDLDYAQREYAQDIRKIQWPLFKV